MPAPSTNPFLLLFSNIFLFLSFNSLFFSSCYSIDVQSQALVAWKKTLNSSNDVLKSWNALDKSPCNWFGIHCNSNGQVVSISLKSVNLQGPLPSNFQPLKFLNTLVLSSANLSGPIPKEFGDYLELNLIDISDNSITGTIPQEICRLNKLQILSLSSNYLEGDIPSEIGNLSSLKNLLIYDNQLSGEIPKGIGKLSNLEEFRAGGNQNLKGELPLEIGNCSNLVFLGLAETGISGNLPPSIGNLKRIQTIAIYTALLSGPIPEEIGNCSELQNLYLYQNSISGSIPRSIGELKKLQSLLLWQNSIVGVIPNELGNCKALTVIDLSENLLTGSIPTSLGGILGLEELQLSVNQLSGIIPPEISNCTSLSHLEVDNNDISGQIPNEIGNLKSLTLFFAWKNNLTGNIPVSLSQCENLQALDLSYNNLFGPIPKEIFALNNLTKLLLLSNDLSGFIPPDVGNCTNLYRFRVNNNRLGGTVPLEIGNLRSLNFLDMSHNHFMGGIPASLSGCQNLEFLDLHSNAFTGPLPETLPKSLQFVDISDNRLTGSLSPSVGSLAELTKLNLGKNQLSGRIPAEIVSCSKLQLLDLGYNGFSGDIPKELGKIPSLEISLNLSCNQFTGVIPSEFSGLSKLGNLDLSHNKLIGNLDVLTDLQNLVSLNVSFNDFSGKLPNTQFFHKLPLSDLTGNQALYISGGDVTQLGPARRAKSTMKLAMSILVSISAVLVLLAIYTLIRTRAAKYRSPDVDAWEMTLYQKLDFSIDDIFHNLTSANVIGTGSSGVVYRVMTENGVTLAVKKMWSSEESGAFSSEIRTLGSIRHKNIVRLLGWASNQNMKLLFYDYLSNGSLSSLLHGVGKGAAEWETRFDVVIGVAHALAYLHHDCVPPIMHGDVKAMNVLLGPRMEPYLADFGLARIVNTDVDADLLKQSQRPHLAGSYGYMAPEHASMQRITEKSDVYSFGVVLLEVLTGRHPLDPTLPGGAHLVQWVREHLQSKRDPNDILDPKLRGRADPEMHEMLQTLAVSFLCVSTKADDRPMMRDVVAMLKEIRNVDPVMSESDLLKKNASVTALPKSPGTKNVDSQLSCSCSFVFSDNSISK
ncbi:PREDICTED: probable LRR receptor-like serine/threonine-protein kinase At4g26540 [Nicotiana attenuata]|uniref:Lrr receptor-like serinethreonine-protein kinase n=1 Tax=Nicotiana attenuata TaxID=49451 RepID=A0A1J6I6D5_NICAT|nr:PREDICTED: probable LRR receptor-like serine/threonine-protein kinase At4g26540 [Nicotiana attenuata]OIT00566.1 putative lrr receptor-like serinethreonine-protein kinase [Nicotiana attenuata]